MIRKPITDAAVRDALALFAQVSRSGRGRAAAMKAVLIKVIDESDLGTANLRGAIDDIIALTARLHGVPAKLLTAPESTPRARHPDVCAARREAAYRVKQIYPSQSEVGRIFKRDHSTVAAMWRRFEEERPEKAAQLNAPMTTVVVSIERAA